MKSLIQMWRDSHVFVKVFLVIVLFGLLISAANKVNAATVDLAINPTEADGPTDVTLTWNSDLAECVASGAWTGIKPPVGTETIFNVQSTTTFTLTCSDPSGTARLSWTVPTEREDGSPLNNLAGYNIYYGTDTNSLTNIEVVSNHGTSEYIIGNLAADTWYFAMTSVDADGRESSNKSNVASKTIIGNSASNNASIIITYPPKPPVLNTVEQIAYEIKDHPTKGVVLGRAVGTIDLGVGCDMMFNIEDYYKVPRELVTFTKSPKSNIIVAKCG